jgi:hypothetical protein
MDLYALRRSRIGPCVDEVSSLSTNGRTIATSLSGAPAHSVTSSRKCTGSPLQEPLRHSANPYERPSALQPSLARWMPLTQFSQISRGVDQQLCCDGSKLPCSIMRISGQFFAFIGRSGAVSKLNDRIAIWANEGGAGGDVNR